MRHDEIVRRLEQIVRRELDWEGELPSGELALHFDSLQLMTLLVAVEDHFHIVVEPDDEQELETAADMVNLIGEKTDDR
jgi:acyl carrier protein